MKTDRFLARRNVFGLSNRAFLLAATVVVGICCIWGTTFNNAPTANAQVEFQGGATPEMLNFALNFRDASDFAVFSGRGIRNQGDSTFRGRVGSTGEIEGISVGQDSRENYGQAKQDLKDALRAIAQLPCADVSDTQLGGKTFTAGVYCLPSAGLTGTMTLNGSGDPHAR